MGLGCLGVNDVRNERLKNRILSKKLACGMTSNASLPTAGRQAKIKLKLRAFKGMEQVYFLFNLY